MAIIDSAHALNELPKERKAKDFAIYVAAFIIFAAAVLGLLVAMRVLRLHILIEEYYLHHWLTWTGTTFIAVATPTIYYLKKHYRRHLRSLVMTHAFGNLIAAALITVHFSQQITRPVLPELGTGLLILYPVMLLLVATGFSMRFLKLGKKYSLLKYLHTAVTLTFYFAILVHVLHGLGYI